MKRVKRNSLNHSHLNFARMCYTCLFIFLLLISISALAFADEQEEMKKSIQIINPRPDFALSLRLDKGTGATYAPGERIRVYFRATKNSYVTVFGYDVSGKVRLLFPNQSQKNPFVEENRQYSFDGIVEPGTPSGFEYIQGFATTEPVIMTRELERRLEQNNFPIIEEGSTRFIQRIRGILTNLPSQRWVSSDILHYQVLDQREEAGRLQVTSSPSGADIYLSDRYAGKTPLTMEHVRVGEYIIRVELLDYQVWSSTIRISPNRTTTTHAGLERILQYGSIAIRSNENNARIYVDNQYMGTTDKNRTILLDDIRAGFHEVKMTLSGYQDWIQTVEVKPNQRVQITVNIEPIQRTGRLEITSDVDNALIYLDDNYQRRTSANRGVTIDNLREGSYELRIVKEGYLDYIATVRILPNQTHRMDVRMQPERREGSIGINSNENNGKIFVNGTYLTTTSASQEKIIDGLKEGLYEVAVIKDGYRVWVDEIRVYGGRTTALFAELTKIED